MPHSPHAIVLAVIEGMDRILTDVVIGVLTMSSRSIIGRRDIYWRVDRVVARAGTEMHTVRDIDPDEPPNIKLLLACE